ncbi:MAG: hypothetical protein JWM85_1317 [Acidimicrobiaceae bacterium]|nr:hypothetical protein [Acidimicrobiaceae bacterium]
MTARGLAENGRARLGLGTTRDVVMIDAELATTVTAAEVPSELAEAYGRQAGWDPRMEGDRHRYFVLVPDRIQFGVRPTRSLGAP